MNEELLAKKIATTLTETVRQHSEKILHSVYNEGRGKTMSEWGKELNKTTSILNENSKTLSNTIKIVEQNRKDIENIINTLKVNKEVQNKSFFRNPKVMLSLFLLIVSFCVWVVTNVYALGSDVRIATENIDHNTSSINKIEQALLNIDKYIKKIR